jgi:ABC-type nitrate/sulfonate/bicarbonate transport system substrate-binding protein
LDGAIIWQPQYQAALDSDVRPAVKLLTTDEFDPNHTCCVIGAQHKYLQSNSALTIRFLAAYVKGVDWVNEALKDKSSEQYSRLISIAEKRTGGLFDKEVLEEALDTVKYTYGLSSDVDTKSAPLMSLENDIEKLVDSFYSLGALKRTMADLGFSSTHEFSQRFVNDGYLVSALDFTPSASGYSMSTVNVAVIAGDIHQIAVHVASELGFFEQYGLKVNFSSATNGAGVAEALQNGEADLGFLGAPPITTTVVNGMLSHS